MKNAKEKSVFETTYANLKVFFDDIYNIINMEIEKIELEMIVMGILSFEFNL